MYVLYQVGDVPLYDALLGFNGDPVEAELSYSWRTPSSEFDSGGFQFHIPSTRSLPEIAEFELKGRLIQNDYIRVSQLKTRLRSFGGRSHVPIIVYDFEESDCNAEIRWLLGYGVVTEDSNNNTYHSQEDLSSFISQDLELTINLQQPFIQLPVWFWELRSLQERLLNPFSAEAAQAGLNGFSHPRYIQDIPPHHYFVRWQEPDTGYDPSYWGLKNLYQMSLSGSGSDYVVAPLDVFVYGGEDSWAIPPNVLYAFTGLSPLGTISIETELKTGLYNNQTLSTVSVLDLVQLDDDLTGVGYGGLTMGDEILTGISYPRPGFVRRNGVILDGVRPAWEYPYGYPGEIGVGATWISFIPYLTDMQVAYSIDFRTS